MTVYCILDETDQIWLIYRTEESAEKGRIRLNTNFSYRRFRVETWEVED
jgi:hypothetical protein